MSQMRKNYIFRLIFRSMVLMASAAALILAPEIFTVLEGMNFFREFSVLHLLWVIWVWDMIQQILPVRNKLPLGSMKLFANRFRPAKEKIKDEALRTYIATATRAAYKVFALWLALLAVIGILYYAQILNKPLLFLISVAFYVCDLICVLIWCPFRLMMKTRCCTTCRIFNWDHFMMFSPMYFMGGFYGMSLALLATADFLVWEISVMLHPERFWDRSNQALKCSECTDKLCSQYCKK